MAIHFKLVGWFFLIVGVVLMYNYIDVMGAYLSGEIEGSFFDIVPFLVGFGQAIFGLLFIRASKFLKSGGPKGGLIERHKLEKRILEMESLGKDASRYRKILDKLNDNEHDKKGEEI